MTAMMLHFLLKMQNIKKKKIFFIGGAKNVYLSRNDPVSPLRKFSAFFVNSANKIQYQEYLFQQLQNLAALHQKKIVYSLKERCLSFNPLTIEQEYFCHQHKADTKISYHAKILDSRNYIFVVVIDAEDTIVLVISAYASHKLEKDVNFYRRNKLIKCKSICSAEMASVLIGFHALIGADAVSGFYCHSKKTIYTKIQKNREGQQMLLNIRKNEKISQININSARKSVKMHIEDKSDVE